MVGIAFVALVFECTACTMFASVVSKAISPGMALTRLCCSWTKSVSIFTTACSTVYADKLLTKAMSVYCPME